MNTELEYVVSLVSKILNDEKVLDEIVKTTHQAGYGQWEIIHRLKWDFTTEELREHPEVQNIVDSLLKLVMVRLGRWDGG